MCSTRPEIQLGCAEDPDLWGPPADLWGPPAALWAPPADLWGPPADLWGRRRPAGGGQELTAGGGHRELFEVAKICEKVRLSEARWLFDVAKISRKIQLGCAEDPDLWGPILARFWLDFG